MDINDEYQLLLMTLPLGVGIFDENGYMVFLNDAYASILGIEDKNVLLRSKHNIFKTPSLSRESKDAILRGYEKTIITHNIIFSDETIRNYYHSTLHTDIIIKVDFRRLLRSTDEKVIFSLIISDITQETLRKRELELMEERNKFVYKAAEMTQYDYLVKEDKLVVLYSDKLFSGKKEISLDDYVSYFHPDDAAKYADIIRDMKAGRDFSCSINYKARSIGENEWHDMLLTNVPLEKDKNGKVIKYTGLRRDNTKWAKLLNDLEKVNLLNQTVIERMPCMFFMKNANDDFRYVLANQMFCAAMGKSYNEIIGHTDYDLMVTSEEADKFRKDDIEAVNNKLTSFKEETYWGGVWKVWHTTKLLLTSTSGERYLVGMSLDITSLNIAFEELKKSKEAAERSDLLKSTFLANMSHEIRTPLNAIVGFSHLLLSSQSNEEKKEYEEIITNNSELLLKLINDILDLSKIEAGYLDFKNEKVDLSELFEGFRKNYSKMMRQGVSLACINPYKSCVIEIDKNRITQVINNLVSNAIKYTVKGYIKLGYEIENAGIKFYVEDTGIGISDENKCRVFERFEKFDSFAQGTGLGLSICKVIAETVGGKIGFSSKLGVGSTFWIWVPSSPIVDGETLKQDAHEKVTQLLFTNENKNKIKILAAEDNDSNFLLLKSLLKGFIVDRAKTGIDAVNMARENPYSIIFMDLKMPVMSGIEATRLIRGFNHNIPIVALTAHAFDSDKNEAMKAGCTFFLTKPLKMNDILCIVGEKIDN